MEKARGLYLEIMQNCRSCMRAVDPLIKRRYADIGFEAGEITPETLELYLSLTREDPENQGEYFLRISRIYSSLGNEKESARFRALAREVED